MDWAFNSLYGVAPSPQFVRLINNEDETINNPLTKLVINPDDVLYIEDLQNTICINAWDNIPLGHREGSETFPEQFDKAYKLYMYYYLYHFIRSPRTFNRLFNSYINFY